MHKLQELCQKASVECQTLRSFDTLAFPAVASVYTRLLIKTLNAIQRELVGVNAETHVLQTLTATVLVPKGSYIETVLDVLAEVNRVLCFDLAPSRLFTLRPAPCALVADELGVRVSFLRRCAWDEFTRWRVLQETLRAYVILSEFPAWPPSEWDSDV